MIKSLVSAVMIAGVPNVALSEVENEIQTGDSNSISSFAKAGSATLLELRTYHATPGKLDALLARFRDHTLKLFEKHGISNVGYWVPVDNEENMLIYIVAHGGRESRDASWKAFKEDPEWKRVVAESEADGKLVEKVDQVFMVPTDFLEGFAKVVPIKGDEADQKEADGSPEHLFEMRTYTATPGNLSNLDSRFRDHTCDLFKKHGMTNLAYFHLSPDQPNSDDTLLYFLAHEDKAAAKKSWDDFVSDPQWVAAKKASEKEAGGSLTALGGVKSIFLKATDFSPVK